MASSSMSGGGRRPRRQPKQQPTGWWPSWLPPYNSGGGDDPPEPEPESGSKPPPGIDVSGYTPTPGYSLPPAPHVPSPSPAPPPGTNIPGYTAPSSRPARPPVSQGPESRPPATTRPGPTLVPPDLLDTNPDTVGSREQQIAALNNGQASTDIAPDIGGERYANEYDPRSILEFLTHPGEERTPVIVKTMSVMTGSSLDDEEQDADLAWNRFLQTVGPYAPIDYGPWYTTRLGPPPSSAPTPFQNNDGNKTSPDGSRDSQPDGRNDNGTEDDEADERWYREPLPELNHPTRQALAHMFPQWNPDWTTREQLQLFLIERLSPFIVEEVLSAIPWGDFTELGMVYHYHSLIQSAHSENWSPRQSSNPWIRKLDTELFLAGELLSGVAAIPLENEARLLEEFGYPDAAYARYDLIIELQFAYGSLGIPPPDDLHEWSVLQLANEYRDVLANVFTPYYSKEMGAEAYSKSLEFVAGYEDIAHSDPETMIARLEGRQQQTSLELVLFVASFFIEPVDWYLTGKEMVRAAEEEDWWGVFVNGVFLILPFVSGRVAKGLSNADQVREVSRVSRRAPAASGSNLIEHADGLLARPGRKAPKDLRKQLEYVAEYNPSQAWRAPDPGTKQQAHHMVPKGMAQSKEARDILEEKGISLHSYHNGIALEEHVHYLMAPRGDRGKDYADSVNAAILSLQHAPREEIEIFLEDLALRFDELNAPGVDYTARFQTDIMDWLATYK